MNIISRKSTHLDLASILDDLTSLLSLKSWDAGFIFISGFSRESACQIAFEFQKRVNCKNLLGSTCSGVITDTTEIENQPAVCAILLQFDHVLVTPFYLTGSAIAQMSEAQHWYKHFDVYPHEKPNFFIIPDPFSVDINELLNAFNKAYPLCPVIGGLASASSQAGENTLILNTNCYDEGCIGLSFQGDIRVETIVSQGCRPVGKSYVVTRAEGNIIYELGGRTFYSVLEDVLTNQANDYDRRLAQEAVFIGISADEYKSDLKLGDFLIRPVIGLDQESQAGAVADYVQAGQTIKFHLRDAVSATDELISLLSAQTQKNMQKNPSAALIFSCNGRGKDFFNVSDHDLNIIKDHFGKIPLAGFFCSGEIGPVAGKNFSHGLTSSIALFYPSIISDQPHHGH